MIAVIILGQQTHYGTSLIILELIISLILTRNLKSRDARCDFHHDFSSKSLTCFMWYVCSSRYISYATTFHPQSNIIAPTLILSFTDELRDIFKVNPMTLEGLAIQISCTRCRVLSIELHVLIQPWLLLSSPISACSGGGLCPHSQLMWKA